MLILAVAVLFLTQLASGMEALDGTLAPVEVDMPLVPLAVWQHMAVCDVSGVVTGPSHAVYRLLALTWHLTDVILELALLLVAKASACLLPLVVVAMAGVVELIPLLVPVMLEMPLVRLAV